ncbi:MAG: hypothetical protein IT372_22090 [Polyangiaceae bacterium]|nr:hypothetical protein [Polyangiaceae bacterium]
MSRAAAAPAALAALLALAGCAEPHLEAITVPPPGKTAELIDSSDERSIQLSQGVALGFSCTYRSAPCAGATASSGDASVARAFSSYADELSSYYCDTTGGQCATPGAVFVLLGARPGATTLTVATDDGDVELSVEVVP